MPKETKKAMNLFLEALQNDLSAARRMVRKGFNINMATSRGESSLLFAVRRNNVRGVKLLLGHGANVHGSSDYSCSLSPLCAAILMHKKTGPNHDTLKLLLENGANCNEENYYHDRPLHFALRESSLECVKLLLEYGGDITAVDRNGRTALHHAAMNSRVDVIQFVLDRGLDIECSDKGGWSALHDTIRNRRFAAFVLLLRRGTNVNKKDTDGQTPLFLAVGTKNISKKFIQTLFQYGANASDIAFGETVLEVAVGLANEHHLVLVIEQLAVMECLNLDINEYDLQIIENNDNYRHHYKECLQEIQDMKSSKFYNDVSIFDVFMGDKKVISGYARNEELLKALSKGDKVKRFPIYFIHLRKKFLIEVEKQRSRKTAAEILSSLLGFNDPFHVVSERILSHLTDRDLKFLTM